MSLVYHTMHSLTTGCGLANLTLPSIGQSLRLLHCTQPVTAKKWKFHPERDLTPPVQFKNTEQPPDRHRLPIYAKTPHMWLSGAMKAPRQTKELWRMMGEEAVHNDLLLDQYGIIAMTGGMVKHKHFEVLRMGVGKYVKPKESFSMYRIDPPYKPITDHGFGKRMGGGKGTIDCYGTPVRAGRVILEVGGKLMWEEARPWLQTIAAKLPFEAIAVNSEMLQKFREEEDRLLKTNKNPISFEWLVRNNMLNCQQHLSEYDRRWFGKFVYKDRELNKKWQLVTRAKYPGRN
eukprot:GFUD01047408.1.p1 GENE.GFUD01047408.1~~GFUD01047408.1.p1  ORF type:complete len:289 (-),score=84.42 GFUD01047408.1:243-1109(-)